MNFLQTMALESAARILAVIVEPERVSWKMKPVGFLKMGSRATSESGFLIVFSAQCSLTKSLKASNE